MQSKCTRLFSLIALTLAPIAYAQGQEVRADSLSPTDKAYLSKIDSSFTLSSQGEWASAERLLQSAIQLKPGHPLNIYLLNNIGGLQQAQGHIQQAVLSYSAALEKHPEEQTIRFNRARLYALTNKHKEAITDYSILVGQAPKNELYLYQRAMSYMLSGAYDLADLDLTSIIQHNSESLKARLGYALLETMRGRYDEAERLYDYLASKLTNSPEVYEGRARLYHKRGMRGYAQRDLQKAFDLAGKNTPATLFRLRAEIARSAGDEAAAKRDEATAQELERRFDPLKNNTPTLP